MDVIGGSESVFQSEDYRLTLAAEGTHLNDNNERFNIGSEISGQKQFLSEQDIK